jgi:Ca2+-binding EF-hand superfamily protein
VRRSACLRTGLKLVAKSFSESYLPLIYTALPVVAALVVGCERSRPAVPVEPQALQQEVVGELANGSDAPATSPTITEDATAAENASAAESTAASADPVAVAQENSASGERLLLCLPDGPLLVELRLTIDGQPHTVVFDRLVDQVLAMADVNQDGRATWQEVLDSPKFKYGQLGNIPVATAADRQQVLKLYDVNSNGLFDRNEIPRFLTRGAGGSRPFSLTSSNEFRRQSSYQSRVFRWLDTDEDGALSEDEWAAAAARLRLRDTNEDELLVAGDFREATNQAAMISNRRRASEPDTAFLLSSEGNWESLLFSLEETYALGDRLRAESVGGYQALFAEVDANGDGVWQRDELPRLLDATPHVVLSANFGELRQSGGAVEERNQDSLTPLTLLGLAPALGDATQVARIYPRRIALRLAGANIEIFLNDMVGSGDMAALAASQFEQLDRDKNGYLDADEYPQDNPPFQMPFEAVDTDGDGKIYLAEAEAVLVQRQAAVRSQIRARAADQEDALFTALDRDGDGRLNLREAQEAGHVLAQLDANQDGRLTPSEIPSSFVIGLVRGDPQQGNNLFVMPTTPLQPAPDTPAWFASMDVNGDSLISAGEFLGTPRQFAQWDADGDGFLSLDEVLAVEVAAYSK